METIFGLSHNASLLLYAVLAIVGLIVLIAKFNTNPFIEIRKFECQALPVDKFA